jgi:NhaA family Na+:H+ antiporter
MTRAAQPESMNPKEIRSSSPPHTAWGVFARFVHSEVTGSVILLACALLALLCANSPWREGYEHLLHTRIGLTWGARTFALSAHEWTNDGLMVLFFFVVGLEIKREVVVGHLSAARLAILPASAALGGMLVPAAIYAGFNVTGPGTRGWGIPMATDIAFALGVLALLGPRVPVALKVFLTALAIADDLGAVLVIALFYTESIRWPALAMAGVFLVLFFIVLRARLRRPGLLFLPVLGVWLAVFASGLHATVAGILAALMVPMKSPIEPQPFVEIARAHLSDLEQGGVTRRSMLLEADQLDTVFELQEAVADLQPPGLTLERFLHPVQAYVVLPLFAFFNAGIAIDGRVLDVVTGSISVGVILGLAVGKPLGITLSSWLAVRSGLASLPPGLGWPALGALSWLAGIGFTMSLFVSELAFKPGPALGQAKIGILAASLLAAVMGYVLLRLTLPRQPDKRP